MKKTTKKTNKDDTVKILIEVKEGGATLEVQGKRNKVVIALGEAMHHDEDFREMVADSLLVFLEKHLKDHGINLREVMREALAEHQMEHPGHGGKKRVVN